MVKNKTMIDFIQGEQFKTLAKYTYAPKIKILKGDYDDLQNTVDWSSLKDGDIIYTHMMYTKQLFDILLYFNAKIILITHSCDCSIEDYGVRVPDGHGETKELHYFTIPNNVIKWYSKNVNTVNPKIESLPIGLENAMWHKKVPKIDMMRAQLKQNRKFQNLVYLNHKVRNNAKERQILYDLFTNQPWVTVHQGGNGHMFDRYINQVYNHKFVFSPEGNGIDTIRTWECLHMGTIPIEKRNINNQYYTDLPICFVNDWTEVTPEFLNAEYDRIKAGTWNMEKLTFSYWRDKILNTSLS